MTITQHRGPVPWLLLIFSLPSKKASERVSIWRKLQKFGTLPLRNSGYVLPNTPGTWSGSNGWPRRYEALRASLILQVQAIDDLPAEFYTTSFANYGNLTT